MSAVDHARVELREWLTDLSALTGHVDVADASRAAFGRASRAALKQALKAADAYADAVEKLPEEP